MQNAIQERDEHMNKWIVGIGIAVLAVLAVPILVVLAFVPVRVEVRESEGMDNQVPSDLHALTVHDRLAIELTWTPVNQGTATYVLQRLAADSEGSWVDVATLEPGAGRFLDQGLEDDVTYSYRIRAFDPDGGAGYSNVTSAIATDLPRPQ